MVGEEHGLSLPGMRVLILSLENGLGRREGDDECAGDACAPNPLDEASTGHLEEIQ